MTDVAGGRALDERSQQRVSTFKLAVDIIIAGYPCVDLSGLNNQQKKFSDAELTLPTRFIKIQISE